MYGGLLKSASAVAIVAAAGLFTSSAFAADLGGDCCADLEERVAELEATTARKGNRKVSLKISGFVGSQVMFWNDGTQSDMYVGLDGGNIFSRWRFTGSAKISPQLSAGFTYEFGLNQHSITSANQLNGGDDLGECTNSCIRDTTVWLKHAQLGMIKIGQGSTATDNLNLIDLGASGSAGTPDLELYNGAFILRSNGGLLAATNTTWSDIIRGNESFDTSRRNHVLYQTPTLAGFTLQAAVAEDNFWDVALRYAGEFNGIRVAAGIGYREDTEFNSANQFNPVPTRGDLCDTRCDVKSGSLTGSASVLHVPTGLYVTTAFGHRELSGSTNSTVATRYSGPDIDRWMVTAGISKNFFGIGRTVVFGEYTHSQGGMEQSAFLGGITNYTVNVGGVRTSSSMEEWGVGISQTIDAAAMELFATYKNFSASADGFLGVSAPLNRNQEGISDFSTVIVGSRINF